MRRALVIVGAAGALSACALPSEHIPRAMSWSLFESSSEGMKLVLGVPETDNVAVMLACQPRSGMVDMTLIAAATDPAAVELRSGQVIGHYAGAGIEDEEIDTARDIQLKIPTNDPVIRSLYDTGKLEIVFPSRRIILPNAFAPAHDFLNACRPQV